MRYDAVVIGSGAAGLYFALSASKKGKKIALVEKAQLGGTAFATGCLPVKKIMDKIKSYEKAKALENENLLKLNPDKEVLFKAGIKSLENIESFISDKLSRNNIDVYIGDGEVVSETSVKVNEALLETEHIILATGTTASTVEGFAPIDHEVILSHESLLTMKQLPEEMTILGGNVEGIEFVSMLSELGVKVRVIEKEAQILQGNDEDLIENIKARLINNGVELILNTEVTAIEKVEEEAIISFSNGESLKVKSLLVTGIRKPNIPKGIEELKLDMKSGFIKVDENLMTSRESIYAVGDINGIHGMAHIALQQGILLADYIWEGKQISTQYSSLPRCIFTINELAGAGCQEHELENCVVKKLYFKDTFRGLDSSYDDGFMKIIMQDEIVKGIWINSIDAGALVGNVGLWIDNKVSIEAIKRSLFIHPTLSEALIDAIID